MDEYSIKNTTKQQRIELIRSWTPEDEMLDDSSFDMWDMYRDYIEGIKEISECNAAFKADYVSEPADTWTVKQILEDDFGCEERLPGEPLSCIVNLMNGNGERKQIKLAEALLTEKGIREGSKLPAELLN